MSVKKFAGVLFFFVFMSIGVAIGFISIYKASVDGVYKKMHLEGSDRDYVMEVDFDGLRYVIEDYGLSGTDCGVFGFGNHGVRDVECGIVRLGSGNIKSGAYSVVKGFRYLRGVVSGSGGCDAVNGLRINEVMYKVLPLLSGNVYDAIVSEYVGWVDVWNSVCF